MDKNANSKYETIVVIFEDRNKQNVEEALNPKEASELNPPLRGLEVKKRASISYRTAQPSAFARFPAWRIKQELVV